MQHCCACMHSRRDHLQIVSQAERTRVHQPHGDISGKQHTIKSAYEYLHGSPDLQLAGEVQLARAMLQHGAQDL